MKKFGMLVLAAVIGSAITIGATYIVKPDRGSTLKVEHVSGTPAIGANYTVNENGKVVPLEFTDVANEVMPAVVNIKSTQISKRSYGNGQQVPEQYLPFDDDMLRRFFGPNYRFETPDQSGPQTRVGMGSGVIISADGYIVTNNHVIDGADDIEVTLHDNRVYKAKVIGSDPSTDLALIQIKEKDLPFVPFVNSDDVQVGEWVLAVGNPFNLNSTVTAGIVSAKARNINILDNRSAIESFIQTDAAINPGNSGGALVDLQGGLIGINTAIASPTGSYTGYGFAVPSNIVDKVVQDLMEYGMVQRGYLGLLIRNVDGNLAKEEDLDVTEGVYVDSLTANSAAGDAGLKVGDVITAVNGTPTKSTGTLLELVGRQRPGDEVSLKVDRHGKEMDYLVELRNQEGETKLAKKENNAVLDQLGVQIETLDKADAKKLDIPGGVKVTGLSAGKLKSHTDIRVGFIVTKVDGKTVKSKEDFISDLQGKEGGVLLEGVYADYPGEYYYAFGMDS